MDSRTLIQRVMLIVLVCMAVLMSAQQAQAKLIILYVDSIARVAMLSPNGPDIPLSVGGNLGQVDQGTSVRFSLLVDQDQKGALQANCCSPASRSR